jgi:hypothetical protein
MREVSIRRFRFSPCVTILAAILALGSPSFAAGNDLGLETIDPVSASLSQILAAGMATWRQPALEVYRWNAFPDVLILDLRGFLQQDRMFARLAYFVEKRGFRGTLLTDAQLEGRHGWNAHDYGPDGLASFFNAAASARFPLTAEELALRRLALAQGVISEQGGLYAPGSGGVLSVTHSSSAIERRYLLTHESFHGIFFSSAAYRDVCFRLWDSLPDGERSFYATFLDSLGYDGSDRYLAVNEFQAYLMQQPLGMAVSYFDRFIKRFAEEGTPVAITPEDLLASARALDAYLRASFGFGAGAGL